MRHIDEQIGKNIAIIRHIRGLSQRELADILAQVGDDPVTEQTVAAWEHGRRSLSPTHLHYLAKSLGILEQELFDGLSERNARSDSVHAVLAAVNFSNHERDILRYAALDWLGDTHAFVEMIGAYCGIGSLSRANIAELTTITYRNAARMRSLVDTPYQVNIHSIDRAVARIKKH